MDDGHDRCQQLHGGDLRLARFPLLEELFRDNLGAAVGLALLLSRSPSECDPSLGITYPPSGIWSGTVAEDDNVRWDPVAGVSNGPGVRSFLFSSILSHMYNALGSPEEDETNVDVELEYRRQLNALR